MEVSRPRQRTARHPATSLALAIGLLAIGVRFGIGSELRQTPIVRAIQAATPSIVNIRGEKTVKETGQSGTVDPTRRVNGMGTGVVLDPRGYVVTNHHVVSGVREILVTSVGGREYTARLVAHDPATDLAIIKIDPARDMPVITLGSSEDLMLGETVIAVGNAYGYENTITQGIVSALHRAVQVSDAQYYEDLIQTDASINPGNSGGPLLNIDGEMIGLNVAVRAGAQGIGFAIPVDKVLAVVSRLLAEQAGSSQRHGIQLAAVAVLDADSSKIESIEPNSPAALAGLKAGDLIVAVDNQPVARSLDFHRAMLGRKAGEPVQVTVRRGDEALDFSLSLAEAPAASADWAELVWEGLGVELEAIPAEQFRRTFRTRYRGGMSVVRVRPGGPAAEQGILPGDVLVGLHIWETLSMKNVAYVMSRPDISEFSPVKVYLLRNNDVLYGHLSVSMKTTVQR
ncbi:MAG: PDZ domain-containing protein [Pirellulaceae bacterium]|jgi:serine protease Do|nr:PDZ domain-containing protein [Pirellulaceae bacterium]